MVDSPLIGHNSGRRVGVVVSRSRFNGWVTSIGGFCHARDCGSRPFPVRSFCDEASLGSVKVGYGILILLHSVAAIAWARCAELTSWILGFPVVFVLMLFVLSRLFCLCSVCPMLAAQPTSSLMSSGSIPHVLCLDSL